MYVRDRSTVNFVQFNQVICLWMDVFSVHFVVSGKQLFTVQFCICSKVTVMSE